MSLRDYCQREIGPDTPPAVALRYGAAALDEVGIALLHEIEALKGLESEQEEGE